MINEIGGGWLGRWVMVLRGGRFGDCSCAVVATDNQKTKRELNFLERKKFFNFGTPFFPVEQ